MELVSTGKIYQAITAIMKEVGHIAKSRTASMGSGGNYNFRGVDDAYAALQLVMAKHGVFTVPVVLEERCEERQSSNGRALFYRILKMRFTFFASDGSSIEAVMIGEGLDSGDKAANKAMSVAHKYALLQVFLIPTSEAKDPENDNHEVQSKNYTDQDFSKRIQAMKASFAELGVSQDDLEGRAGRPIHEFDENDIAGLRKWITELRAERDEKVKAQVFKP